MDKYIRNSFLVFVFIVNTVIASLITSSVVLANSETMSVSQLVELLINIGAISPDKASAARAVVANLNTTAGEIAVASSSLPYIQVLSPNGSENWQIDVDVPYSITWGSSSPVPVNISLVPATRGSVCNLTSLPIVSKKTTNTFNVLLKTAKCFDLKTGTSSPLTDGSYRVRVSYVNGSSTVTDESDKAFKILPKPIPSIKIAYPNGGEKLVRNNEYIVKYTLKNVLSDNYIYFYLIDSDGNITEEMHNAVKNGSYKLEIPYHTTPGAYKLKAKIITNDKVEVEDISDNFFWISSASD